MKHLKHVIAAVTLMALFAGCQILGVQSPKTFNERLAAAYTTEIGVVNSVTILNDSRIISKTDAVNLAQQATTARDGLDMARELHATTPQAGEDRLTATLVVLQGLQGYLAKRQKEIAK